MFENNLFTDTELSELHDDNSTTSNEVDADGNPIDKTGDDNTTDDIDDKGLDDNGKDSDDNNDDNNDNTGDDKGDNKDDEPGTVDTIINEFGIELEENEKIEDSIDGLKTVINKVSEQASVQAVAKVFEKYPLAGELVKHLQEGLTIESFLMEQKAVDYSKVEVPTINDEASDEDNERVIETHKDIITKNLKAKGASDKEISRFIKASIDENSTEDDAKEALAELTEKQSKEIANRKAAEKQQYEADVKAAQDTIKSVVSTVDSGVIGEFKLPKADIAAFKDFLVKFDEKGNSPRDLKSSELTLEQSLLLDYILFKDFKVTGLEKKSSVGTKQDAADKNAKRITFKSVNKSNNDNNGEDDDDKILSAAFNHLGK